MRPHVKRSTVALPCALALFSAPTSTTAQEPRSPVSLDLLVAPTSRSPELRTTEGRRGPPIDAESVAAFFDAAFELQRLEHRMVGAVVSVVQDGEIIFERGYGWADLERRTRAHPETSLFRIASITKPFVWTAIMQLVERGRLDLDADVNRYLDFEVPATYEDPVRVWHLLSHTAGFEETWTGWGARTAEDVGDLGEALRELMPARVRPPGRHAAYSNYGAALAGYIVERVSGRPWAEYVEREILGPLGMRSTNTRVRMRPELRERHATGYVWRDGRFDPTGYAYSRLPPAGIMSSTAHDMAAFMLVHLNGGAVGSARILGEETTALMQSPLFDPHEELPPILHGFYRSDRNGQIVLGHGGDTNQFHSAMSLLPEHGLGVFVSYNSDPASAARGNVVAAFLDHFFPVEYLRPTPEPADVDVADYAGDYIPLRSAFTTFERLRSLFGVGSVQPRGEELALLGARRLVPTGPDRFTGVYDDVAVVFERDERGRVSHMLVGSPLATFKRARGLEGGVVPPIALFVLLVSSAAVLVWLYRVFRPIPERKRLPSPHVRIAWIHALLTGGLMLGYLELAGGTIYGVPPGLHVLLLALNANLLLGLVVVAFSVRQWIGREGTLLNRAGYTLVALASVVNLGLAWAYNVVAYVL